MKETHTCKEKERENDFWAIRSTNCKEPNIFIYTQLRMRACINQYQRTHAHIHTFHKRRQFMSLLDFRISDILVTYTLYCTQKFILTSMALTLFQQHCSLRQWIFFLFDSILAADYWKWWKKTLSLATERESELEEEKWTLSLWCMHQGKKIRKSEQSVSTSGTVSSSKFRYNAQHIYTQCSTINIRNVWSILVFAWLYPCGIWQV